MRLVWTTRVALSGTTITMASVSRPFVDVGARARVGPRPRARAKPRVRARARPRARVG